MPTTTQPDLDQLINEFHINGFAIIDDFLPVEQVDAMHQRIKPMMDRVEAWNDTQLRGDRTTGQGRVTQKKRFKIYPPFEPPFSDPQVTEHPLVMELLERLWGSDDIELISYSSNCPAPGTAFQNWHRDGMLFATNFAMPVYPAVALKFPLVDTNEQNGSIEVIPCTHHCSIPELNHVPGSETAQSLNTVVESGRYPSKMRLNLKRGTGYIMDPRVIHRGTRNRSDHTRIELGMDYVQAWFGGRDRDAEPQLTQRQFDTLSDRGKRLLRHCTIVD